MALATQTAFVVVLKSIKISLVQILWTLNFFLESRTKKLGLCGAKQGSPGEEYITDPVPKIKKEKEAMMFQGQIG